MQLIILLNVIDTDTKTVIDTLENDVSIPMNGLMIII